MKAIIIEAGHGKSNTGGVDNGASKDGLVERELTKAIAGGLFEILVGNGLDVFGIGIDEEETLSKKISDINMLCDTQGYTVENCVLLSIHINAGGGHGIETFTYKDWIDGIGYGNKVLLELNKSTGMPIRGAKYESQSQYPTLGIVHETTPSAILVECGFIDNHEDRFVLQNNLDSVIEGLYNGLAEVCGFDKIGDDSAKVKELQAKVKELEDKLETIISIANS